MNIKVSLVLVVAIIASYSSYQKNNISSSNRVNTDDSLHLAFDYIKFEPNRIEGFKLNEYQVDDVYELDSFFVFTAYSDGDLESSSAPTNWGDRLILMKGDSIHFQSKPVGDPYQFEPFFYHNTTNDKVIIICQLGNEENYGGEAFLLENGSIEFIGEINIESPYETADNTGLIEIIRVSETENAIYFNFESDSLIDLTNSEWRRVKNDGIHYVFKEHQFTLIGL
ncbi:MAG: hypothetical protein ACJASQ_001126 [Crocinitomicaceae bacterium]|jgi:hypothetical protein